jgi:uncharacterized protein YndB with AHSA1/START domain
MLQIVETTTVAAPIERVFRVAVDPNEQLRWDSGTLRSVEKLSPGELGTGARYRSRFKGFGTVDYEYAEYEAPRRFAHVARVPIGRMTHRFTFAPAEGGTEVTQTGTLDPNILGRIMRPLARSMLSKRLRLIARELSDDLRDAHTNAEPPLNGTT